MKLTIDFPIPTHTINVDMPQFCLLGSCFAQEQAERIKSIGFPVYKNPFGILYNPFSLGKILTKISTNESFSASDFIEFNNRHFSLDHHGNFEYNTLDSAIESSNQILATAHIQIKSADIIVVTLGTSIVFKHILSESIVGNCHQLPNTEYHRQQLSFEETTTAIQRCSDALRQLNKSAHLVFTVSPIRHIRSGIVENSVSKSTLISAVHTVLSSKDNSTYFPSYEIFIDELRDYRFAKPDLVHPNQQASDYIWERFQETYLSDKAVSIIEDVLEMRKFEAHRSSKSPEVHLKKVADLKSNLLQKYPGLNLTK